MAKLTSQRQRQQPSPGHVPDSVGIEEVGHSIDHPSVFLYIYVAVCYLWSHVFGLMLLSMLMTMALFTALLERKPLPSAQNTPGDVFTVEVPQKLDKKQRKLTRKLEYYVQLEGYKLETHKVTTSDGFRLVLHRITVPGESAETQSKRYPVLLIHGLLQSSAAYCTSGPQSHAFTLLRNGYDVWLGNNRCGFTPDHAHLSSRNLSMWTWRIQEMGTLDLSALVDYVRHECGTEKIALVAHSQGTAETFIALARDSVPELGEHLSCFVAISPAVYAGPLLNRWFLRWIKHLPLAGYQFFFGFHSFLPIMMTMQSLMSNAVYATMGYLMFHFMFGWNDSLWDLRYRARELLYSPVYVSAQLMFWWLGRGGFGARGCIFHHERTDTPWFDSRFPPLLVVVPALDDIVDPHKLVNRLKTVEEKVMQRVEVCELEGFSHLDPLWARDAPHKVGLPMLDFISSTRPQGDWLV